MAKTGTYKINISGGKEGPGKGLTKAVTVDAKNFNLIGFKIRQEFDGGLIGYPGFRLKITGGSNSAGTPMRFDVEGPVKKRILLSGGPCFRGGKKRGGLRVRKLVCGNEITDEITQINVVVVEYGKEKLFQPAEEES